MPETSIFRTGRSLKLLGQAAPSAAADATLYAPPARFTGIVTLLVICNTGAGTTFRIHHDNTGATRVVGNALYYDTAIGANATVLHPVTPNADSGILVRNPGALSVRSLSGNVTFSAYGGEEQIL